MDSMRSLNTSLPRSPRRRKSNPPPEQLIQTFKAAALSVTNLYKTAATDQVQAREAGYQDALDDVLAFLDKENLGLGDGEGWRVRQWATERLDGSPISHGGSDSDDDRGEMIKRVRSTSPVTKRAVVQETEQSGAVSRSASPLNTVPAPIATAPVPSAEQPNGPPPPPEVFSFRSASQYPQDVNMQTPESLSNTTTIQSNIQPSEQISPSGPAVRVEVVPRPSRMSHRGNRHNTRAATGIRSLGTGAGAKRAFRFGDFEFDLGSLGEGKDGAGGGAKRGRFT